MQEFMWYLLIRIAAVLFVDGSRIRSKTHKRLRQRVLPSKYDFQTMQNKRYAREKHTHKHMLTRQKKSRRLYRNMFWAANVNRKVRRSECIVVSTIVEWKWGITGSGCEEPRPVLLGLPCFKWGEERLRRMVMNAAVEGRETGGTTVELKVFEEMPAKGREWKWHGRFFRFSVGEDYRTVREMAWTWRDKNQTIFYISNILIFN